MTTATTPATTTTATPTATATSSTRPRRSDAVRNAQRVLHAAAEVFAEHGPDAGMDDVAERAGVGKGTVYRCYPTKEDLLAAVAGARVAWFTGLVHAAEREPDAWTGLTRLLRSAAQAHASNALLVTGLGLVHQTPELTAQRAACRVALQRLLDRGRAEGTVRADASVPELTLLFCGTARALSAEGETDLAVWRRYADLVLAAFRA